MQIESQLIAGFVQINRLLQKARVRYCLIGGIAAGYWGKPRYTQDMDFKIVSRTGEMGNIAGLLRREHYKFQKKGKDQIKIHGQGSLKFAADLLLAATDYEDWVVQRARPVSLFDIQVPICSVEDLIVLKLIANRRQDLLDIEKALERNKANLDWEYLKKWLLFWDLTERFEKEFSNPQKLASFINSS